MWQRRSKVTLACCMALLLLVSGCTGGSQTEAVTTEPPETRTSTATQTATPTSTSTQQSPTPTLSADGYPPGFNATGYADRRTALRGHIRALRNTSFTSTTRLGSGETIRIKANLTRRRVAKRLTNDGSVESTFFFENGSARATGPFSGDVSSYNQAIVYDGQFEDVVAVELADPQLGQRQGTTVITYDVTGEGMDGNLTVTVDGLITRYSVERSGGSTRYEVTNVGNATVDNPF